MTQALWRSDEDVEGWSIAASDQGAQPADAANSLMDDLGSATNAKISTDNAASPSQLMATDWCGLGWGPWVPLEREAIRRTAPKQHGVYRIRRQGENPIRLVYIGQTGRTLRERLLTLNLFWQLH